MRTERDSMGEMSVPDSALYGASTQRAVLNFPVSGHRMPDDFIRGLARVKSACARANAELGLLPREKAEAIVEVCREIHDGALMSQFPVDVFQTGSGTSTMASLLRAASALSVMMGQPTRTGECSPLLAIG